ncbi:MAG: hypothetical protein RRB13_09415 [bacterium]|nr:hypothetical protein [bacterium]
MIRRWLRHLRLAGQLNLPWRTSQLKQMVQVQLARDSAPRPNALAGVVFSFDRALQLFALLESYFLQAQDPAPLSVLFRASSKAHQGAYAEVRRLCKDWPVTFVEEYAFRSDLLDLLAALEATRVFFLVDDILFTQEFDFTEALKQDPKEAVFSLRHGAQLDFHYMLGLPMQRPPLQEEGGFIRWRWRQGEYDWGYPLSVDGHIFDTREFLAQCRMIPFKAPNSLEHGLQIFWPLFADRAGVAYATSRQVNVPYNKVQQEFANKAGALDPEKMLAYWNQGQKLDVAAWKGYANRGVHEDLPLKLTER